MLKYLGGDTLQVLAVCLLSTLLSIVIPAKYKVTESTTYSQLLRAYQRNCIVTCRVSNRSCELYSMLPQLSIALYKLFHVARSSAHVLSRINLCLHGEKCNFPCEVLHGTACGHMCRSEIIPYKQLYTQRNVLQVCYVAYYKYTMQRATSNYIYLTQSVAYYSCITITLRKLYFDAYCTCINLHICSSYHTQFRLLGKGIDEASSDIDTAQESRETTDLDENVDFKNSQPVKHQKMSKEITETEVTSCKFKVARLLLFY